MATARLELRTRATVVVDFELDELVTDNDDVSEVLGFLDEDCERVQTPRGDRWTLDDRVRTQTLHGQTLVRLRAERARITVDPTALQRALDRSLRSGWKPADLARLTAEQARALGVVAGWWAGNRSVVPDPAEVRTLVSRSTLFADLRAMAGDHFVGRRALLDDLREHFQGVDSTAFVVYGVGGVGKSAVLARHLVWAIDEGRALAAVLDFDDPSLNPNFGPADLANRIVDAVTRQLGDRADRLRGIAIDVATTSGHAATTSGKTTRSGTRAAWVNLIDAMLAETDTPILVVLDTFEQVQRRGPAAVAATGELIQALLMRPDRIRVVVAGRADVGGLPVRREKLTGLEPDEAIRLFTSLSNGTLPKDIAQRVVARFGTSPLTIRLAAQLLSTMGEPGDLFELDLQSEQLDAELYRRVLAHIGDPDIRRLAHPGLILRRITPELIQHVLAKPCKVTVRDEARAWDLFHRFAREPMLVEPTDDGSALVHRTDVREIMLPQLLRDRPDAARSIQRAAVKYYANRTEPEAKIEELYHRLMLEQSPSLLAKHWNDRAAQALAPALAELPRTSRAFLAGRLPETFLRDEDRELLSDAQWTAEIEPQVVGLVASGALMPALDLLRERPGRSLLPALEIEVLEGLGRYAEAIEIARTGRQAAAASGDAAEVVTFSLHLARLLERTRKQRQPVAVLDEALASVRQPTTDRLRLLTAWLGLRRRLGRSPRATITVTREREAVELYRRIGAAQVRKVPGLLRDLAAEVGTLAPDILAEALRTVGLDAAPTGAVPSALAELDRNDATGTGTVADLARLVKSGAEVDWDGIVTKPRGETGKAVAEVITTFPEESSGLHEAVAADYQHESDTALFPTWSE